MICRNFHRESQIVYLGQLFMGQRWPEVMIATVEQVNRILLGFGLQAIVAGLAAVPDEG